MMKKIVGLAGNTRRPSKTRALVAKLVHETCGLSGAMGAVYDILDMPDIGRCIHRGDGCADTETILREIETADALVMASPVYKGSYCGLFKHVIDLLDPNSLLERPVLIGATGGGQRHALMVEHQMRPLFGFFGACSVPLAVYASDGDFHDGELTDASTLQRCLMACGQLASLMERPAMSAADPVEKRWA